MGIRHLNNFLLKTCTCSSIQYHPLSVFKGKIIVIDTSIYMYKCMEEGDLMKNMNIFISVLLKYGINPVFIFDGKPPKEKNDLLMQRRENKWQAEQKYKKLLIESNRLVDKEKNMLVSVDNMTSVSSSLWVRGNSISSASRIFPHKLSQHLPVYVEKHVNNDYTLNELRKQFLRISIEDINSVKKMIHGYGLKCVDAPQEADELCVDYVRSKRAWACMSDDMDMFVHGCPRILRKFNMNDHQIMYYNLNSILTELKLTMDTFRDILVISGTDYNIGSKTSLYKTLKLFNEFRSFIEQNNNHNIPKPTIAVSFYEWLKDHPTKYIENYDKLITIRNMYIHNIVGEYSILH
jgi:5'-3' exonuclease